jgi:hypothetical protein
MPRVPCTARAEFSGSARLWSYRLPQNCEPPRQSLPAILLGALLPLALPHEMFHEMPPFVDAMLSILFGAILWPDLVLALPRVPGYAP